MDEARRSGRIGVYPVTEVGAAARMAPASPTRAEFHPRNGPVVHFGRFFDWHTSFTMGTQSRPEKVGSVDAVEDFSADQVGG
jgi:hypothetical protein